MSNKFRDENGARFLQGFKILNPYLYVIAFTKLNCR